MQDITLVTSSFNTPQILELMLKSFVKYHPLQDIDIKHKLLLYENSTDEVTEILLSANDIPFKRTVGGRHADSLDKMLIDCSTRYALVVDSDILFRRSVEPLFTKFKESEAVIMGEECGDRGGFKLYPRIHPWFMFLDIKTLRDKSIRFNDWKRIEDSDSTGFYQYPPLQTRNPGCRYDVGATFYEDILAAGLQAYNFKADPKYFKHYEAMSWNKALCNKASQDRYELLLLDINQDMEKFESICIRGEFSA